jgi:putative transposase
MPRQARVVAEGVPHHVTQRGNNGQRVFFTATDRRLYLSLLAAESRSQGLRIAGYCLMPNHVHLIVTPELPTSLALGIGRANNLYSRYLNRRLGRKGHLWQNRFYSAPLDRPHLWEALRYVDLNPVRAGLVERAEDWADSSAAAHLSGADPSGLLHPEELDAVRRAGDWQEALRFTTFDERMAERIRAATHGGKPLGEDEFVADLERRLGRDLRLRPRGRPPVAASLARAADA